MTDTTLAPLGALVREKREGLQLSMDELARRAHISRSSVHRIEHAHATRPTPAKLARVLTVVGITADEVHAMVDDADYVGDVVHWLSRVDAVETMGRALQARPHVRRFAGPDRPDLVVIDQESGDVAQIQAADDLLEKLAAMLTDAGFLVTTPRA